MLRYCFTILMFILRKWRICSIVCSLELLFVARPYISYKHATQSYTGEELGNAGLLLLLCHGNGEVLLYGCKQSLGPGEWSRRPGHTEVCWWCPGHWQGWLGQGQGHLHHLQSSLPVVLLQLWPLRRCHQLWGGWIEQLVIKVVVCLLLLRGDHASLAEVPHQLGEWDVIFEVLFLQGADSDPLKLQWAKQFAMDDWLIFAQAAQMPKTKSRMVQDTCILAFIALVHPLETKWWR